MKYHEWYPGEPGKCFPLPKLGVIFKKGTYAYSTQVDGADRHTLEKFAAVLAEQDSAFLRDGGNSYVFGDPAIWRPWFAEYQALPAEPFTRLEEARDPVAVWHAKLDDGFYFYAVNRERLPITITLTLSDAGEVRSLTSGAALPLVNGELRLELAPHELRSFRCAPGARITAAKTDVPSPEAAASIACSPTSATAKSTCPPSASASATLSSASCSPTCPPPAAKWRPRWRPSKPATFLSSWPTNPAARKPSAWCNSSAPSAAALTIRSMPTKSAANSRMPTPPGLPWLS
jgi:hypothetical protein